MTATDPERAYVEAAAALADPTPARSLKELLRASVVLTSLENLMKLDDCPEMRAAARKRYVDLTNNRDAA